MKIKGQVSTIIICDLLFISLILLYVCSPIYLGYEFIGIAMIILDTCCIFLLIKQFLYYLKFKHNLTFNFKIILTLFLLNFFSIIVISYAIIIWLFFK